MNNITVVTPTYNRADTLIECYKSLKNQSILDFNWIIVDDGSVDNTEKVVQKFINENLFEIKYFYKENGGKHTALNVGIDQVETPLTLILDSDDYLVEDAIEKIEYFHNQYNSISKICGFTFLKSLPNGQIMGKMFNNEGIYNYIDVRLNSSEYGEKCDVFYTQKLKEEPFSEYPGETYIGESTVWTKLGRNYNMISINAIIYIAEYQPGGLSDKGREIRVSSPRGGMEYANLNIEFKKKYIEKIKYSILYTSYSFIANGKFRDVFMEKKHRILKIVFSPFGLILSKYWKNKYNLRPE